MKVLHCPTTVGGNPQGLCKAERELGLDSWSVAFYKNYFNYEVDEIIFEDGSFLNNEGKRWALIFRMLAKYDVVHYNFGTFLSSCKVNEKAGNRPKSLNKLFNLLYAIPFEA
ncbi:MAG: glycosyltransferase family 1 protein, partial [Smithella sp.]